MNEETKALVTIIRHVRLVQKHMLQFARELERRAAEHDLSKLSNDEFEGFVKLNEADKKYGYGTPEYKAALAQVNAVELHTSRNSHHPEYHPNGVNDMDLYDFIEMVCDWKAANVVYGQTSFEDSVKTSIERFGMSPEQAALIRLIAGVME